MSTPEYFVTVQALAPTQPAQEAAEQPTRRSPEHVVAGVALIVVVATLVTVGWVVVSTVLRVLQALADAPPLLSI